MINTGELELGNTVYVDEKLTSTENNLRGTVIGIEADKVKVRVKDTELTCLFSQIYPVPLFRSEFINLGFVPRSIKTASEEKQDLVLSIETDRTWYLLEITEVDSFLTVKKEGRIVEGSGIVKTLHQLQNMVNQITRGIIKIEGL